MGEKIRKIGLFGTRRKDHIRDTLEQLIQFLTASQHEVVIEKDTAELLPQHNLPIVEQHELYQHCDLLIVVGGDGSMLSAARIVAHQDLPVIGINRGQLGFLTDIYPEEIEAKIAEILRGQFEEEKRFLLTATVFDEHNKKIGENLALNDVVLLPGQEVHMFEFELYIDGQFLCHYAADGMIIATPTGSTAYALSGGGPILHPILDAITLVPMFPHTLTDRPIVVPGNTKIELKLPINRDYEMTPRRISCDGHNSIPLPVGGHVVVKKYSHPLRLLHPLDYNYPNTIRTKLHWGTRITQRMRSAEH